jgi:lipoprotein-anchoring transpeptidase ErfK/SrfK
VFGQATLGAVYAFQKVHELERDGVFRTEHWELLGVGVEVPETTESPNRVEVDLDRQVLLLVKDSQVEVVLPISSGNGEVYRGRGGSPVRARTPEGSYSFYRKVSGWRISYLGGLYNPFYFRGGYAIHGSSSVPPYPASHGCVRVEIHDMDYLKTQLSVGMPVYVYGINVARADLLPQPPPPEPSLPGFEPMDPFEPLVHPAFI